MIGWGTKSGVIDDELKEILKWINSEYKSYLTKRPPTHTYFGTFLKNVMIHDGRLPALSNPTASPGRSARGHRANNELVRTHYGRVYLGRDHGRADLSAEQRKLVTMYAPFNRTF